MKNILVPTDFSEDSMNAVTYALELLKNSPCNFYLLHVNDLSGISGTLGEVIGSNTGDVITKVKCNTLAVPMMASFRKLEEIAFPTDYNIFYSAKILSAISDLLETNNAYMRVMHASKSGQLLTESQVQNKEYLKDYLNETFEKKNSFHFITNKNVIAAVQCFVESRNIDLLVMVAKNLNFLQQIVFSSEVEKISFHTKVPFLVIHD